MKLVTFLHAPDRDGPESFSQRMAAWLREVKAAAPSWRGGVARMARADPRGGDGRAGALGFDAMVEIWLPCAEDFRREILPAMRGPREMGCRYACYAVTPRLQMDPRVAEAGAQGRRPALTYVNNLVWKSGVAASFAAREWEAHATIALRAQPRMSKYEQNLVTETICWTEGITRIDAYADFSFASLDDFCSGFVVTEEEVMDMASLVEAHAEIFLGDAAPF